MEQAMISPNPEEKNGHPTTTGTDPASSAAPHAGPHRKTVLIVDDVAVMRLRMRPQLEEAGYHVVEAEDGKMALDVIAAETKAGREIDLIVSDVSMPIMDGLEMIRRLRHDPAHLHLPIIVCTAKGELGVVREAKALGVQGFLVKPVTKPTLLATVKREMK